MTHPIISTPKQGDFLVIPGGPLAYTLQDDVLHLFEGKSLRDSGNVLEGLHTTDHNRFVRFFWETSNVDRWHRYVKGGGTGKWHGYNHYWVDWQYEGGRLDAIGAIIPSRQFYFIDGWTYSKVSRGALGCRLLRKSIFTNTGAGIFIDTFQVGILNSRLYSYILRCTNNQLALDKGYIERLPSIEPPERKINFIDGLVNTCCKLKELEVSTDTSEFNYNNQSFLSEYPSIRHSVEGIFEQAVLESVNLQPATIQAILAETGTPAGWHPLISGYDALPALPDGLDLPPLPQDVHAYLAAHERRSPDAGELARIKANLRALYEAGPGAKDVLLEDDSPGDDENEAFASGAHIPIPTETFLEELSVKMELHPISIYWLLEELRREGARCKPEELRLLHDRLSVLVLRLLGHRWPRQVEAGESVPEWADQDGIIPLTGSAREQTLTERVRLRLRAEEGDLGAQRSEALLAELTGFSLDEWLRRQFFAQHVRQFKHRPVAWHLTSTPQAGGKGKRKSSKQPPAFECVIYYHACAGDILARVRTQYVEPLLHAEQSRQHEARKAGDDTAAAQASTRLLELEDFVSRLRQVEEQGFACADLDKLGADEPLDRWSGDGYLPPDSREELLHNERAWHVDINDGVRVNIAPLQLAGLLASDVLKAADAKKALADRARWRSDERRWVREGKLPRCGWLPDSVPESEEWTRLAPQRRLEQERLEEKRRRVQEGVQHEAE